MHDILGLESGVRIYDRGEGVPVPGFRFRPSQGRGGVVSRGRQVVGAGVGIGVKKEVWAGGRPCAGAL